MYELRRFVEVGGLMSYGVDDKDIWRHAASYVDKILKGVQPATLPIEQPTNLAFQYLVDEDGGSYIRIADSTAKAIKPPSSTPTS